MASRNADFLLHWLNTTDSLAFIVCIIVLLVTIYHIYLERNVSSNIQSSSTPRRKNRKKRRRWFIARDNLDNISKWCALTSILFLAISCITEIYSRTLDSVKWTRICFISTQCTWAIAIITSHLLFIRQLYVIYNKSCSGMAISNLIYIILYTFITLFASFMFTKSILIKFLDWSHLTPIEYGKISASMIYGSSLADLVITIIILYLFNSKLSKTMKHSSIKLHSPRKYEKLFNVRLKHTILSAFGVISSQLYLISWTITALIWYNYKGKNKMNYVYDLHITTITFRNISCITNSLVILFNFHFGTRYYDCCCFSVRYCCYKRSAYSGHRTVQSPPPIFDNGVKVESKTEMTATTDSPIITLQKKDQATDLLQ
eukprot:257979_1